MGIKLAGFGGFLTVCGAFQVFLTLARGEPLLQVEDLGFRLMLVAGLVLLSVGLVRYGRE